MAFVTSDERGVLEVGVALGERMTRGNFWIEKAALPRKETHVIAECTRIQSLNVQ